MNSNKGKKATKSKGVRFLLAPRSQKDPLAADFEAPQHVLLPKDGTDIDEIRQKLPDFDPDMFASKGETRTGMLERAHNADGLTFDPDILQAMSKDFDYEDPNNILDDTFITDAGGLIEDEGELLDDEMTDLTNELFEDEPEVITFDRKDRQSGDDRDSIDSDDYDVDNEETKIKDGPHWQDEEKDENPFGYGKRLILFKKKANKPTAISAKVQAESARQLQEELNAHFRPEAQRLAALRANKEQFEEESDEHPEDHDDRDETETIFTNYSMTSSVMRRSQGLKQIDEHFETLYEKEYADDTEIGPLDLNEVRGEELLSNLGQIKQLKEEIKILRKQNHGDDYEPEIVSDHHKTAIIGDDPADEAEDLVEVEFQRRVNRVDCESILSYNSNLYNHPKLIMEPRRRTTSQSTTDQMEVESSDTRSRSGIAQSVASSRATIISKLSTRPMNETPEERKARKKALREYRQERRQERKQNQQIFKSEQANLIKQQRTNRPALKLA